MVRKFLSSGRLLMQLFHILLWRLGAASPRKIVNRCDGSTSSQLAAPRMHNAAAARNDVVQPNRAAIQGVSEAVSAAPIWLPIFIKPDTEPEDVPARSAVTDQKELCAR